MPVSDDHTSAGSQFTGKIKWVQLDAGTDDNDHPITPGEITPGERLRVATARR